MKSSYLLCAIFVFPLIVFSQFIHQGSVLQYTEQVRFKTDEHLIHPLPSPGGTWISAVSKDQRKIYHLSLEDSSVSLVSGKYSGSNRFYMPGDDNLFFVFQNYGEPVLFVYNVLQKNTSMFLLLEKGEQFLYPGADFIVRAIRTDNSYYMLPFYKTPGSFVNKAPILLTKDGKLTLVRGKSSTSLGPQQGGNIKFAQPDLYHEKIVFEEDEQLYLWIPLEGVVHLLGQGTNPGWDFPSKKIIAHVNEDVDNNEIITIVYDIVTREVHRCEYDTRGIFVNPRLLIDDSIVTEDQSTGEIVLFKPVL